MGNNLQLAPKSTKWHYSSIKNLHLILIVKCWSMKQIVVVLYIINFGDGHFRSKESIYCVQIGANSKKILIECF